MKTFTLYTLLFFTGFLNVFGQSVADYDDIMKTAKTSNPVVLYAQLLQFQKTQPEHANCYYQLGLLSQEWSKALDPFFATSDVEYYIYNSNLFFGLCAKFFEEKSARKDGEYYQTVPIQPGKKRPEFEDIKAEIEKKKTEVAEYKKHFHSVLRNYRTSINFYNQCIETYRDIISRNFKIKDIYLTANDSLRAKAKFLAQCFDSTIYFFKKYKEEIAVYPIGKYNPTYKLVPIETYRLNGLTSSNFLQNEFIMWDYGKWVKDLFAILDKDIVDLRSQMNTAQKTMESENTKLYSTEVYGDSLSTFQLKNELVNRIGMFDFQSVMQYLFLYEKAKLHYLKTFRKNLNNTADTTNNKITLEKKARYYNELLVQKKRVDSLLNDLQTNITPEKIAKYQVFTDTYFKGQKGFVQYCENEKKQNNQLLNRAYDNLQTYLLSGQDFTFLSSLQWRSANLLTPTNTLDFQAVALGKYQITDVKADINNNFYLTGFYKQTANSAVPFLAKTQKKEKVLWLKTLTMAEAPLASGMLISPLEKGCAVVVSGKSNAGLKSMFYRFDANGNEQVKGKMETTSVPCFFTFDEINQSGIILSKGSDFSKEKYIAEPLFISKTDSAGKALWTQTIQFAGTVFDVIKSNENYLVMGNFTKISKIAEKEIDISSPNPNLSNPFVSIIDKDGFILKTQPLTSDKACMGLKAIKINSNTINILGNKSSAMDSQPIVPANGMLFYALCNSNADFTFSNLLLSK